MHAVAMAVLTLIQLAVEACSTLQIAAISIIGGWLVEKAIA